MNFLLEGRKEDILRKHYVFEPEVLDRVLSNEFIKKTNYKYADWILSNLDSPDAVPEASDAVDLVMKFHSLSKNLEKKDINQYSDIDELKSVIDSYSSKSQEKKISSEAVKVHEDDRVLIVRPLTHRASCKYGAGTKWCTTEKSPGYFDKHTIGDNRLYYVIIKELDASNKFYKMALHKNRNQEDWYDSMDVPMPPREVQMIVLGIGKKGLESIEKDYNSTVQPLPNKIVSKLFDDTKTASRTIENFVNTKKNLTYTIYNANLFEKGMGEVYLDIKFDDKLIDKGKVFLLFDWNDLNDINLRWMQATLSWQPDDEFEPDLKNWPSLTQLEMNVTLPIAMNNEIMFENFWDNFLQKIIRQTYDDMELIKFVHGSIKNFWRPNRRSYGFTFEKKGGLIEKLVKYIDDGNEGSAIDFLINSGTLFEKVTEQGEKIFLNKWGAQIIPKGYFSAFFASAVSAGIISYRRQGRKYILTKGPNFEDFKLGNLKAL